MASVNSVKKNAVGCEKRGFEAMQSTIGADRQSSFHFYTGFDLGLLPNVSGNTKAGGLEDDSNRWFTWRLERRK